tara:strand:+ start:152 stop:358 length:207 start_codon:yes stop_codon:yes gene_type:complete
MALALAHHPKNTLTAELTSEQPIVFVLDTHVTFLTFLSYFTSFNKQTNKQTNKQANKQTSEASNALVD